MQPPAEVEPARISHGEQASSSRAMLKMSAARAVSRELKDILRMESMIGRASKLGMSMCSTVVANSSALALERTGAFISRVSLWFERPSSIRNSGPDGATGRCLYQSLETFFSSRRDAMDQRLRLR